MFSLALLESENNKEMSLPGPSTSGSGVMSIALAPRFLVGSVSVVLDSEDSTSGEALFGGEPGAVMMAVSLVGMTAAARRVDSISSEVSSALLVGVLFG